MNISVKLKEWLVKNGGVKADATDDEFRTAAADALAKGLLTVEKYSELSVDTKADEANEFDAKLNRIADGLDKLAQHLTAKADGEKAKEAKEVVKEKALEPNATKKVGEFGKVVAGMGDEGIDLEGKDTGGRIKAAVESYSTTKSALTYPRKSPYAGRPVTLYDRQLDSPSDRDKALSGIWAKFQIMSVTPRIAGSAQRAWEMLSEHEKGLLHYLAESEQWDASADGKDRQQKGYPGGIKALIDDATSGGLEAAPIVFDDQVIQAPLLNGELFPLVTQVPLDRGRRIEGVSTGTVTGSWGGVDDTAIALFATAAYVAAFDTTIYRWQGAIRIGLDFLSDTPIDFNSHVTQQYGERLLEDLDDVIATGNGTTQPEGIMNHAAVTSVAFGGATSLAAYESLRFAVTKQEHKAVAGSAVFCGTEASYMRAMAIPVGASDVRRLTNTVNMPNYDGYVFMNRPYKINGSLTNSQIFYAILARYRMYRRKGLTVRTSTEGDTLIRANEVLITVTARYGGQLERAACAALTTTAPA